MIISKDTPIDKSDIKNRGIGRQDRRGLGSRASVFQDGCRRQLTTPTPTCHPPANNSTHRLAGQPPIQTERHELPPQAIGWLQPNPRPPSGHGTRPAITGPHAARCKTHSLAGRWRWRTAAVACRCGCGWRRRRAFRLRDPPIFFRLSLPRPLPLPGRSCCQQCGADAAVPPPHTIELLVGLVIVTRRWGWWWWWASSI